MQPHQSWGLKQRHFQPQALAADLPAIPAQLPGAQDAPEKPQLPAAPQLSPGSLPANLPREASSACSQGLSGATPAPQGDPDSLGSTRFMENDSQSQLLGGRDFHKPCGAWPDREQQGQGRLTPRWLLVGSRCGAVQSWPQGRLRAWFERLCGGRQSCSEMGGGWQTAPKHCSSCQPAAGPGSIRSSGHPPQSSCAEDALDHPSVQEAWCGVFWGGHQHHQRVL